MEIKIQIITINILYLRMTNIHFQSLNNVKDALFPYMSRNIFDLLNTGYVWSEDEMDRAYFSYLCIMNRQTEIEEFLTNLMNNHGTYATYLFINALLPRHNILLRQNGPPLMYAVLWNSDPSLLRLLYYYGADFNWVDDRGIYINDMITLYIYEPNLWEFIGIPATGPNTFPLENLGRYNPNPIPIPYMARRNPDEFASIITEFDILVGEAEPTINWRPPLRHNLMIEYARPLVNLDGQRNDEESEAVQS